MIACPSFSIAPSSPITTRIVVAVSGGIDSMVSARSARIAPRTPQAGTRRRPRRPPEAQCVGGRRPLRRRPAASAYGIPFESMRLDPVGAGNFHERARNARYAFFRDVARRYGATKIALAHQADDQAETILMRLVRGAGLAGYAGISERSRAGRNRIDPPAAADVPRRHRSLSGGTRRPSASTNPTPRTTTPATASAIA
ncbi:MAG: tRNA lysidine(34) synthetase TilS [Bacillus subtilis]|nr:tRNA lysidine(34) synthetase TilS [Bacillus subtilis]